MAKQYAVTKVVRVGNAVVSFLNRFGAGPPDTYLLRVKGRKSGELRMTPLTMAHVDGERYLVAPYGDVGWVHNLRAQGSGTLERKQETEEIAVEEIAHDDAAPVLLHYFQTLKIVRAYFEAEMGDGVDRFREIAGQHPVFRIV